LKLSGDLVKLATLAFCLIRPQLTEGVRQNASIYAQSRSNFSLKSDGYGISCAHCAESVYCWNDTMRSPLKRKTWQNGASSLAPLCFIVPP
jgi:hypothetical protein